MQTQRGFIARVANARERSIGLPQITRKTQKELPKYTDINETDPSSDTDGTTEDTFILAGAEDLVPVMTEDTAGKLKRNSHTKGDYIITPYMPRTEGLFSKIERWYNTADGSTHWRSVSRENVTNIFGISADARIAHPDNPNKIFSWLLEQTYDAKGNIIIYEYKKEDTSGISAADIAEQNRLGSLNAFENKYLKTVYYGNKAMYSDTNPDGFWGSGFMFKLIFDYGEYADDADGIPYLPDNAEWDLRPDPFSSYRAGFEIRSYRRCKRVLMHHDFGSNFTGFVKATIFNYEDKAEGSLLNSVQYRFFDPQGETKTADMPPLSFKYSHAKIDPRLHKAETGLEDIFGHINSDTVRFADINAVGLPGILVEDKNAWYFKENLGDINYYGTSSEQCGAEDSPQKQAPVLQFGSLKRLAQKPTLAHLSGENARLTGSLTDIDGDGKPELMVFAPPYAGYYKQKNLDTDQKEPQWQDFIPFRKVPNINMGDPNLKSLDITGDGSPDLLITEQNCFVCWPSDREKGWEQAFRVLKAQDEEKGPAIVFNDGEQSIYLADMSGDGLTDIVRVRNNRIDYWANLGYGRFSEKRRMAASPQFDYPDLFKQSRIRLADIDGSGTADILYLGTDSVKFWINQSGNRYSDAYEINTFPTTDHLSNVFVTDLFGSGTSCLVWSSPLPDKKHRLMYIDLMSGIKPYLLVQTDNNMGGLSRMAYTSSTKFYLKHKQEKQGWKTNLPFPVQVLERTEKYDQISDTRFVSLYEYRDGYYDGFEREFRGFGTVYQRDTEQYSDFVEGQLFNPGNNTDETSHIPPVLTVSKFHLGIAEADGSDTQSPVGDFSAAERREAYRALRGKMLRTEIYAEDGSALQNKPYSVSEKQYRLDLLQEKAQNKHAVFLATEAETRSMQGERKDDEARHTQSLVLMQDEYGQPLRTAEVAYPAGFKCTVPIDAEPEQQELKIIIKNQSYINADEPGKYFIGLPLQSQTMELTGADCPTDYFTVDELKTAYNTAQELAFEENPTAGQVQKRLVMQQNSLYHGENTAANNPLPFGEIASHGLPYAQYQAVFTDALLTAVYEADDAPALLKDTEILNPILTDAGYIKDEGLFSDSFWYKRSPITLFNSLNFFLPYSIIDQFGNTQQSIDYDTVAQLLPYKITDGIGNITEALNDFRLLQPYRIKDINDNISEVRFDTRGAVVKSFITSTDADGNPLGDTEALPGQTFEYNLFNYIENAKPNYVKTTLRTRHAHDELADITPLPGTEAGMISYSYTGGFGQEILTKVTAEDTGDGNPQWAATGRTVLNNKGKAVKQYEPYFSPTPDYETEEALSETGVTPLMHYDALGRLVRTDLPDGTFTKVEFTPWEVKNYDTNDTVLQSPWYAENAASREAILTVEHANTPQIVKFDVLGREFLTLDHNGFDENNDPILYSVRNHLDIAGNITKVTDAKGRNMTRHAYDMAGRPMFTHNIDSGARSLLADAADKPLRQSDARGHLIINSYDTLQRPTVTTLNSPDFFPPSGGTEGGVILKTDYGTTAHKTQNRNGLPYRQYDQSGITTFERYDFKGNPVQIKKQFCDDYQNTIDWSEATVNLHINTFTNYLIYDALSRPVKQSKPDGSISLHRFNKAGLLEKIQIDHKGQGTFTDYVTDTDYNARGQRSDIYYANGSKTKYEYDPKNFRLTRLLSTRNSGADILQDINYSYDPEGNITEILDNAQQNHYFSNTVVAAKNLYEYDPLYRLKSATGREHNSLANLSHNDFANNIIRPEDGQNMRNYTQEYKYDELGNITEMKSNGVWSRDYRYNFAENNYLLGHDLESTADTYLYDAHGNMTKMPHLQELKWDYADNLKEVTLDASGNTAYYVYDASGNRVRKIIVKGNIIENRFYIGDYELYTKTNSGVTETERETLHISDDKQKVALIDSDLQSSLFTFRFQLTNHLDSAAIELDENADIISYEEYHPFGTTSYRSGRSETEVSLKRYKYVFKELDNETGLYYYGMRYYAPWAARFVSVDPLQSDYPYYTPFQYAGNKPISYIDLDGAEPAESNAKNLALKLWKEYILPENSEAFPNISKDVINAQVKQRIKNGGASIRQGKFGLCGPSAACKITASHTPVSYVATLFQLYEKGSANEGKIITNEAIRNAKLDNPNTGAINAKIDGIPAVDWILLHSLRYSENQHILTEYNPHDTKSRHLRTLRSEFPDLLDRLNANVSIIDSGSVNGLESLDSLIKGLENNKRIVLFVDSRQYIGGEYEGTLSEFVSQNYGRHFIVVKDMYIKSDDSGAVVYWDAFRDDFRENSVKFESFEQFDNATMYYWVVKNNITE